ncbi:streptophobe family protein [Streptomyces sp. MS06]|uniref:streptophobe family protein n=1 Tax=Streptomyces sp. MS06 TaxID=3385974 RepID=UPI0039A06CFD
MGTATGTGTARHRTRVPWGDVLLSSVTAVSWALIGMAGTAALGLHLLRADSAAALGPMTAAVVALAAGGSVTPTADVSAYGLTGARATTSVEITPLGVSLVGALLLSLLFLRSLRRAGAVIAPAELLARAGTVLALCAAVLRGLAWAGHDVVTVDGGSLGSWLPDGTGGSGGGGGGGPSIPGLGDIGGIGGLLPDRLGDLVHTEVTVRFAVATAPTVLGGVGWTAGVLLVALLASRRTPLPPGLQVLHRVVRPAASALVTVGLVAVAAGLAAAGYAALGDDHPRRIASAALLGAPNGVWLGVPTGLFVPWRGRTTGVLTNFLPDPLDRLLGGGADRTVTVGRLAELDGRVWLLAVAAALLMLLAGVLTAVRTPLPPAAGADHPPGRAGAGSPPEGAGGGGPAPRAGVGGTPPGGAPAAWESTWPPGNARVPGVAHGTTGRGLPEAAGRGGAGSGRRRPGALAFAGWCALRLGIGTALALPLLARLTEVSAVATLSALGFDAFGTGMELRGEPGAALALGALWGAGAGAAGALLAYAGGAAGRRAAPRARGAAATTAATNTATATATAAVLPGRPRPPWGRDGGAPGYHEAETGHREAGRATWPAHRPPQREEARGGPGPYTPRPSYRPPNPDTNPYLRVPEELREELREPEDARPAEAEPEQRGEEASAPPGSAAPRGRSTPPPAPDVHAAETMVGPLGPRPPAGRGRPGARRPDGSPAPGAGSSASPPAPPPPPPPSSPPPPGKPKRPR